MKTHFLMAFASGDILTVANVSCVVTEKQEIVKLALWTSIPTYIILFIVTSFVCGNPRFLRSVVTIQVYG